MKRREFFIRVGGTLLAVPAVLHVASCGGDDDDDSNVDSGPTTSFSAGNLSTDGSGHSHSFIVMCADLSGSGATYTAMGGGHSHGISLDATQLADIAAGNTVEFMTTSVHPHTWSIRKPTNAC
jgi:hypothetical protein